MSVEEYYWLVEDEVDAERMSAADRQELIDLLHEYEARRNG